MKKDKKWLVDKWTKERNEADVYDPMYQFISEFIADVNQLDEPEVLSQEWVSDNAVVGQYPNGMGYVVPVHELQNLLVPKQPFGNSEELPVIPQFVAEWIEAERGIMSNWKLPSRFISDSKYKKDQRRYKWSQVEGNMDKFMSALINGYEVEEEQKYYVLDTENIPMLVRTHGVANRANTHLSIHEKGRNTAHYQLTEQEIKDYDERYMAFAVKVEELE